MSGYNNILVAIDFSKTTGQVIERAMEISSRYDTNLTLMHVVEYSPPMEFAGDLGMTSDWTIDENDLIKGSKKSLQKFAEKYKLSSSPQIVHLGTPKYEITQYAEEGSYDLIIVGSHGRHGLGRLLGSTADGILHHAHCDVLAVRIKE
ncbi:MAG: universal stress protein [Gammaproteobacteria bacterium]|nr:universal stress protein [Gammaproteobacteria bacterium]MCK5092695.1 universal stress protein [Gammaproteobacteria bacterium]